MSQISTYLGSGGSGAGGGEEITAVSAYCLTSDNLRALSVCFSGGAGALYLPDATTLDAGSPSYTIKNLNTSSNVLVYDNGGNLYNFIKPYESLQISLYNNTCANGGWIVEKPNTNASGLAISETTTWPVNPDGLLCYLRPLNSHYHEVTGGSGCAMRTSSGTMGWSGNKLYTANVYYDSDNSQYLTSNFTECTYTNADGSEFTGSYACSYTRIPLLDAGVVHVFKDGLIVGIACDGTACICCDTTLCWCCLGVCNGTRTASDYISTWGVHLPVCGSCNTQTRIFQTNPLTGANVCVCQVTNTLPASGNGSCLMNFTATNNYRHSLNSSFCRITAYQWRYGYDDGATARCLCNVCLLVLEPCHQSMGICRAQPMQFSQLAAFPYQPPLSTTCNCIWDSWTCNNFGGQIMFANCFCRWVTSYITRTPSSTAAGANHIGCFTSGGAVCGQCFLTQLGSSSPRCTGNTTWTDKFVQQLTTMAFVGSCWLVSSCAGMCCTYPSGECEWQLGNINWSTRQFDRTCMFQFCFAQDCCYGCIGCGFGSLVCCEWGSSQADETKNMDICYYRKCPATTDNPRPNPYLNVSGGCGYSPGWRGVAVDYWTTPGMLCFAAMVAHNDSGIEMRVAKMCAGYRECRNYVAGVANGGTCLGVNCNSHFCSFAVTANNYHFNFHSSIDDIEFSSLTVSGILCNCSPGTNCGCMSCFAAGHGVCMSASISGGLVAHDDEHVTVTYNSGTYYACPMKFCLDPTTKRLKPCCILGGAARSLRAGNITCNAHMHAVPYSGLCFITYANAFGGISPTIQQACYVESGATVDISYGQSYSICDDPTSTAIKRYDRTVAGTDIVATEAGTTFRCMTSITFNAACR